MSEQEWLTSDDLPAMLTYIASTASERKQRLYLCGGCRIISHLFYHHASEKVVEIAEAFADGNATAKELSHAEYSAEVPTFGYEMNGDWREVYGEPTDAVKRLVGMGALPAAALEGGEGAVDPALATRLWSAAWLAYWTGRPHEGLELDQLVLATQYREFMPSVDWPGAAFVRCIFGNPFRTHGLDAVNLTAAVAQLATAIYTDRAFDRLPVLADALEEAGCTDEPILSHCRSPGPHVRGCWVVDLILGKE